MKTPFPSLLLVVLLAAVSTTRTHATPVFTASFNQDNWEVFWDFNLNTNGSHVTGFYCFIDDVFVDGGKRLEGFPQNNYYFGIATTVNDLNAYTDIGDHVITFGYRSDQFDGYLPDRDKLTWLDWRYDYTITQPVGGYWPTPDLGSTLALLLLGVGACRLIAARL